MNKKNLIIMLIISLISTSTMPHGGWGGGWRGGWGGGWGYGVGLGWGLGWGYPWGWGYWGYPGWGYSYYNNRNARSDAEARYYARKAARAAERAENAEARLRNLKKNSPQRVAPPYMQRKYNY